MLSIVLPCGASEDVPYEAAVEDEAPAPAESDVPVEELMQPVDGDVGDRASA